MIGATPANCTMSLCTRRARARRHPGVDGIAAGLEDLVAGLRREVVAGAHHVVGRVDGWLHRHCGRSESWVRG